MEILLLIVTKWPQFLCCIAFTVALSAAFDIMKLKPDKFRILIASALLGIIMAFVLPDRTDFMIGQMLSYFAACVVTGVVIVLLCFHVIKKKRMSE